MPIAAEELGQITSVEFLPSADADRIVVQSDRPVDYTVFKPDDDTFVLLFSGVSLSPDASTQLLPEPGGPVSLVSAFAQPELATPEVRLVVKRASGLEPTLEAVKAYLSFGEIVETLSDPSADLLRRRGGFILRLYGRGGA